MLVKFETKKLTGYFVKVDVYTDEDCDFTYMDSNGIMWAPTKKHGDKLNEHMLYGLTKEITEEVAKKIVDTKAYGDHPFFCTLDYEVFKKKNGEGFIPGYCVDHDEQHLESFWSLMRAYGVYDSRVKYVKDVEFNDWLIMIKEK